MHLPDHGSLSVEERRIASTGLLGPPAYLVGRTVPEFDADDSGAS